MRTLEIVEGNNVASVNERRREKDSRPAQLSTQAHASAHMYVRTHTQTTRGDSAVDRQTDRLTDTALESPETNSHSTQKRTRLTQTRTETLAEVPRHVGPHPHLDSETHARKTLQRARLSYSIYILYEATLN